MVHLKTQRTNQHVFFQPFSFIYLFNLFVNIYIFKYPMFIISLVGIVHIGRYILIKMALYGDTEETNY